MDANANAQVIDALYQACVTGDLAAFDAYTDDSVWDELGHNERSGVYRGKQAILEHAIQLAVLADGTIATKVKEILPGGNYVAVIERATAKRKGGVLDMDCCSLYTMREARSPNFTCSHSMPRHWTNSGHSFRRSSTAHHGTADGVRRQPAYSQLVSRPEPDRLGPVAHKV